MTRQQAKDLLPIIQAFAEGKTIQQQISDVWLDIPNPSSFCPCENYRIKPEPREVWVNYVNGVSCSHVWKAREIAEKCAPAGAEIVHFREVV